MDVSGVEGVAATGEAWRRGDVYEAAAAAAARSLSGSWATVEPVALDITDVEGLGRLAGRIGDLGTLRSVAHAAGISPTMADWRRIFTVDLIRTAPLADALRPLATHGTATVCFASMAGTMNHGTHEAHHAVPADTPADPLHHPHPTP